MRAVDRIQKEIASVCSEFGGHESACFQPFHQSPIYALFNQKNCFTSLLTSPNVGHEMALSVCSFKLRIETSKFTPR